jgi:hypothetical protein
LDKVGDSLLGFDVGFVDGRLDGFLLSVGLAVLGNLVGLFKIGAN